MQSKSTKHHLKQSCAGASTCKLKRELHTQAGPHHKGIRKIVYAELVARRHGAHAK